MISLVSIFITSLLATSLGYSAEEDEERYFKREYLSFNRSTNQISRRGIPVQLAPSLEADLKHYKSDKLKAYLATEKRPIHDEVLNQFINQTVLDWCDENLKNLKEEDEDELSYMKEIESGPIRFEYSCSPLFLVSTRKTYRQTSIEQIVLRQSDRSFIAAIPRGMHPERQLVYSERGKLTTYTDIDILGPGGPMRLSVGDGLTYRTECFVSLEHDMLSFGDWILTGTDILPRYSYDDTPLPDPALAAYVPRSLKERLLEGLFESYKKDMFPVVKINHVMKSLWQQVNPSVPMPKMLEAIQAADTEKRLLRKIFSHPTLSHDIGFKGTKRSLEELSWGYILTRCRNIDQLDMACKVGDIDDIVSWQDIFDLSAAVGAPERATQVIKRLLNGETVSGSDL